ncbi:helix-turn-helix transcriptional regulator (plasmid) [Isosphaeraceae bacterium EP7]
MPELTAEQRALVERLDRDKPDFDELIADGTITGEPGTMLAKVQLESLVFDLKARRESLGISVEAVAKESGLPLDVVSELEGGVIYNPTLNVLFRYAMALGASVELKMVDLDDEA